MAVFKQRVSIKKVRAWFGGALDLLSSSEHSEDGTSGLFFLNSEPEDPPSSGLFLPDEIEVVGSTEHHIIRILVWDDDGEHVVFDGTQSQFVAAPTAATSSRFHTPVASSQPDVVSAPTAETTSAVNTPSVSISTNVTAIAASSTSQAETPNVTASVNVAAPTATSQSQAEQIAHSPHVTPPSASSTSQAEQPTIQIQGSNYVTAPSSATNSKAEVPAVTISKTVLPPTATSQATARVPAYSRSKTVTVPVSTTSSQAAVPTVSTVGQPMAMDKTSSQVIGVSDWYLVTSMQPRTGTHPASAVVDSGLVMNGPINGRLKFRGQFALAHTSQRFQVRVDGVSVAEVSNNTAYDQPINVELSDRVELWAYTGVNFTNNRTVQSGAYVIVE